MHSKDITQSKTTNTSFFYGWIIVVISAMGLFFSGPGQTYSVSIFINSYVEKFGWSRTLVSSYYSIATLSAGFILPAVGRAIDRKGHRMMFTSISMMLGIACLWMSFVTKPIMLFIGFVLLRLFGQGSMTLLPSTLVPKWFFHNRGKALSLMALGGVAGSALLPPINNWLIGDFGVSFAWRIWMLLLIVVMAPAGWFLIRNKPEDIGSCPDGKDIAHKNRDDFKYTTKINASLYPWTVKEALRTRAFWLMLFCMVVPSMITTGITFHMVSIMKEKGHASNFAALTLSISAIIQLPLTFVAGHLVDKVKVHYVKAINFCILLFAMILVLNSTDSKMLMLYAILHGTFIAFDSVSTGVIWANYYGIKYLGSIRSITMTAVVIGSALGPLPFGYAYDIFGEYSQVLLIMMVFPVLGSLAALLSPKPKEPIEKALI